MEKILINISDITSVKAWSKNLCDLINYNRADYLNIVLETLSNKQVFKEIKRK
jgi:hypothetical protein